jgi:ribosomal protein S16
MPAGTVGVDADRDQRVHVDDAAAFADLLSQGINPDERVRTLVQQAV